MRILCLPIDSRPCNTQFIERLVSWAGSDLILPRPEEMDDFRNPAPFEGSRAFLRRELPQCDAAVISLDHWCYGSLLSSREEDVDETEALRRVEELRNILASFPHVPVYLSSVILRSSISAFSLADLDAYNAMTEYSVHSDRFDLFGLEEDRERAEAARKRIPEKTLQKALAARKRNLRVNLAAIDLAAEGRISSLCVLQEDCQVYGLPRKDQRVILRHMEETWAENVFLRNGTDEAGAVLAAAALQRGRETMRAAVLYLGQSDFIAPYEDRPFRENLKSACREIGIREDGESDTVICVCCPKKGEQREAEHSDDAAHCARCAEAIDSLIRAGKRVYLLDVTAANGGSLALVSGLGHADGLWGYSAWNTASNAMGTLLAQAVTDQIKGLPNRGYFMERLLDDLIYQTVIRKKLTEALREKGEDPYGLRDKPGAEDILRQMYREELPGLWPLKKLPDYRVSLPWSRVFEVKAQAKDETPEYGREE